jgi:hypothetical protein
MTGPVTDVAVDSKLYNTPHSANTVTRHDPSAGLQEWNWHLTKANLMVTHTEGREPAPLRAMQVKAKLATGSQGAETGQRMPPVRF